MTNLDEDVDSEVTVDPWRKKATTAARYDLCSKCKYFTAQMPHEAGVRCVFGLRPDVLFEEGRSAAKCNVFKEKR